jgi:hypothetical protein
MGLILVFIGAAAAVVLLYLAVAPFLGSRSAQARADLLEDEVRQVEALAAKKTVLLQSLRELEFDHQTAKISDEDYEKFRARYERQAVAIMKQLDAIHGGRGWQETIEKAIHERLNNAPVEVTTEPDRTPEPADEEAVASEVSGPACPACGTALEPDDRFCSQCGERILTPPAAALEASA